MNFKKLTLLTALTVLSCSIAEAFLFGVNLTDGAGTTIAGANPNQTAGILGLGFLTAALGAAVASALGVGRTPATTTVIRGTRRPTRFRGRRETPADLINEILDDVDILLVNQVVSQLDETDCFHRLMCDMAASGAEGFGKQSANIMTFVKFSDKVPMTSPLAEKGLLKLNRAILFGERVKSVETCERVYSNCPISGAHMDKLMTLKQD